MRNAIIAAAVIVLTGAAVWNFTRSDEEIGMSYRTVAIEKGDLESVVSATGNLDAVTTVAVGTQVSGIVDRIYVDFNDHVRKGQLIARIDTTLLVSAMEDARTSLLRNVAQRNFASNEFERVRGLYEKQFATEVEMIQAKYNLELADANIKSAEIGVDRARRNLSYATIYSPINGVVIERNVDVGQTVAASLSAPQLFLIANDLSKLQILVSVDEGDIGKIKEDQEVRFTVQAYDEVNFDGVVRQVRLQSKTQENVVTYTVVVDVDNKDGRLLPGMTATTDFLVEKAQDVLKVPNAALRFRATAEMQAALAQRMEAGREAMPDSAREARRAAFAAGGGSGRPGGMSGGSAATGGGTSQTGRSGMVMLWYQDESGQLAVKRVRTGITDGSMTEIMGRDLEAGLNVIAGVSMSAPSASANPFQQNSSGPRRPGF